MPSEVSEAHFKCSKCPDLSNQPGQPVALGVPTRVPTIVCCLSQLHVLSVFQKLNLSPAFTEGSAQFHSGSCLHFRARGTGLDFSFLLGNGSHCTLQKVAKPSPLSTQSSLI